MAEHVRIAPWAGYAAVVLAAGLAACGGDSASPEDDGAAVEDAGTEVDGGDAEDGGDGGADGDIDAGGDETDGEADGDAACTTTGCEVGDPCAPDADCLFADSHCRPAPAWATGAGICTREHCDQPAHRCPDGSGCVFSPTVPFCLPTCIVGTRPGDPGFPCRDVGVAGVPDAGDFACTPLEWEDGVLEGAGACLYGSFPSGSTPLGEVCATGADCVSPFGLGVCVDSMGPTPFCGASCPIRDADLVLTICGAPPAIGGIAPGACVGGLCLLTCDAVGAPPGSNGCFAGLECWDAVTYPATVVVGTGSAEPIGICSL